MRPGGDGAQSVLGARATGWFTAAKGPVGPFCSGMKLRTGSISGMLQTLQMPWLRGPVGCAEKENWGRDLEVFGERVDEASSVKIVGSISGEGSGVS
ncbi:hypothetical protein E5288_WYG020168 [Bos mutus]|uniref:Uncharacterized protein n=1 Tax=Bos mutus TaxID=72004 RepID=A0A6B0SAZ7_9CETA|nr:hypothetical protein [Bos mutus]